MKYILNFGTNRNNLNVKYNISDIHCQSQKYMLDSKEFCKDENGEWVVWGNNVKVITMDDYIISYKKELADIFSEKMISSLPIIERGDFSIITIGALSSSEYSYGSDRGMDISFCCNNWLIKSVNEDEIILKNIAFYRGIPDEGDAVYFENEILINYNTDSKYILQQGDHIGDYLYRLILEDGKWKFDNFELWF